MNRYNVGTLIRYTRRKEAAIGVITHSDDETKEYIVHWTDTPEGWPSQVSRISSNYLDFDPALGGFTILKAAGKRGRKEQENNESEV